MRKSDSINERQATVFALAAVLCWSTVATAFKLGLDALTPRQLLFQACVFSSVVFVLANSLFGQWRLDRTLARQAVLLGILNPFLYYQILFAAYDRLPAQLAQSVNYTWAITLAILAVPMLGQRLNGRTLFGIVVSYAGVLIITLGIRASEDLAWNWQGLVFAFSSTVVWALYWILSTRVRAQPVEVMTWSFLFATPLIGMACFFSDGIGPWTLTTVKFGLWVGVIEMGIAFLLWSMALRRTAHLARIGQLIFLAPFLSLILIERVLGEAVPASSWVGLLVIVVGVAFTGRPESAADSNKVG
ncbi:MAG: drug/metabolite transporter (DMT)-like permease [Gammaproteobacteria bacterium]|jgi:drug/metabolite transporter (DMT)-like permease